MQQTEDVFLSQVRSSSNDFSTYCIVLKMTYDIRDLTYFFTCEIDIMPFFLLGSWRGLGVSLNIPINLMNYLLALPLRKGVLTNYSG